MAMTKNQYRSALNTDDLISGDVAVISGNFVKLGERKIEAGEQIALGYGPQSGLDSAQGRLFMDIKDNAASPGADLNGVIRLVAHSPQGRPLAILHEFRTEMLRDNENDRTKQVPFPFEPVWLTEDRKLVLEFNADADGTVGKANSTILFDTTNAVV